MLNAARATRQDSSSAVTVGTIKVVPGQIRPMSEEWRVNGTIEIPVNVTETPAVTLTFPFKDCPSERKALEQGIEVLEQLIEELTRVVQRWKSL
ncbi:MAG TPA: hypothetical protein VFB16_09350 [Bauldia sp.]|nr:hypothetical protein [Bauldia sp.]